ncbi:GIY-YIG nuclease family protein [Hymenobacter radiodurans]|nr:GIY-YIG nuclease family protein [Hymenobacter radiodurans]
MYIYLLTNPSKSVLYTGITNNLDRRLCYMNTVKT